jgi:hypothetical protein
VPGFILSDKSGPFETKIFTRFVSHLHHHFLRGGTVGAGLGHPGGQGRPPRVLLGRPQAAVLGHPLQWRRLAAVLARLAVVLKRQREGVGVLHRQTVRPRAPASCLPASALEGKKAFILTKRKYLN